MKMIAILVTGVILAITLVSCQQVFTFSPLTALQRDPAKMTTQQQIAYGESALSSGNPTMMEQAYNAIKYSSDPNVQLLAGQLAFGASGATDALTKALAEVAAGSSLSSNQNALQSVDTTLAVAGAQNIVNAAAAGVTVSDTEYAIAAAAYIASAAKVAGGFDKLSTLSSGQPGYNYLSEAQTLVATIQTMNPSLASTIQSFY